MGNKIGDKAAKHITSELLKKLNHLNISMNNIGDKEAQTAPNKIFLPINGIRLRNNVKLWSVLSTIIGLIYVARQNGMVLEYRTQELRKEHYNN